MVVGYLFYSKHSTLHTAAILSLSISPSHSCTHTHTLKLEPTRTRTHSKACTHTHTHALLAHWLNSPLSAHVASCWLPATFGSSVGWNFFGKSVPKLFGYKIFPVFLQKWIYFVSWKKTLLWTLKWKEWQWQCFWRDYPFDNSRWVRRGILTTLLGTAKSLSRAKNEQESSALSLIIALLCKLQYYGHFSKHYNVSSRHSK